MSLEMEPLATQIARRERTIQGAEAVLPVLRNVQGQLSGVKDPAIEEEDLIPSVKRAIAQVVRRLGATRSVLAILQAGYPRVSPREEWVEGVLGKDPRPHPVITASTPWWAWPLSAATLILLFLALTAISLALILVVQGEGNRVLDAYSKLFQALKGFDIEGLMESGFYLGGSLFGAAWIAWMVLRHPRNREKARQERANAESVERAGVPPKTEHFLSVPLPPEASAALTRAKESGLFSGIVVSALAEAFTAIGSSDFPELVIAGRRGTTKDLFLIWHFDPEATEKIAPV